MTMMIREQDGREEEVQLPMHPIQMMSENTLLFMAKADEDAPLGIDILEPENIYIADLSHNSGLDKLLR